jgi:DNA polymerase I-like protein with 3'-5' exonuclease and polymerase domains
LDGWHAPGLDPNSSADISELLYQRLGLTTSVETDSGALSTSADALKENADRHPVVPHLILYSELNHLRNTYLGGVTFNYNGTTFTIPTSTTSATTSSFVILEA